MSAATLGGSTIAAACGIHPYCSPIRLWLEMTGRLERPETEAMAWGTRLEPVIADAVADELGVTIDAMPDALLDPDREWLAGHVDRVATLATGLAPVECKAAGHAPDSILPAYEAQVLCYEHLMGAEEGYLAVLTGLHLDVTHVPRDQAAIDTMLALAEQFMQHVWEDRQPPPAGHPDDRHALSILHPQGTSGAQVRETREVKEARRELVDRMAQLKTIKAREDHLRALLTDQIGDAEELVDADGLVVARWQTIVTRRLDVDALKEAHPRIYDRYRRPVTTRRLTIS